MDPVVFSFNYELSDDHSESSRFAEVANPEFGGQVVRSVEDEFLRCFVISGGGGDPLDIAAVANLGHEEGPPLFDINAAPEDLFMNGLAGERH